MAKKKDKSEVVETEVSLHDTVDDAIEVETESVEVTEDVVETPIEEVKVVVEPIQEKVEEPKVEPAQFKDTDIVTFYNNKGELRWAAYKYITKRGYKAIELYKTKK